MSFDVLAARAQFPILERRVNGQPLVYLDSAASAQKPEAVIEAMAGAMRASYANVHRGLHALANETTQAYEGARTAAARLINAPSAQNIVLSKGATHAINIVAGGLAPSIAPGDEIILTVMEHHSNIVPWHLLRSRHGAVLKWLDVDDDGRMEIAALERLITPRTRLIACTHMSNVLGAGTPAADIAALARAHGVLTLFDGCQAVVHAPVDVQAIGCDFYVFGAHKLYGPTGVGALYGRTEALGALEPFEGGGEMIDTVEQERITYAAPPHRFEAGTPPILEAIGFRAAIEWLIGQDRAAIAAHEHALLEHLQEGLRGFNTVRVHGQAPGKAAITAFSAEGVHPHDIAQLLDQQGVAVRAGHHCAQPLMARLGVSATARASLALYNTTNDVDAFLAALAKALRLLR